MRAVRAMGVMQHAGRASLRLRTGLGCSGVAVPRAASGQCVLVQRELDKRPSELRDSLAFGKREFS